MLNFARLLVFSKGHSCATLAFGVQWIILTSESLYPRECCSTICSKIMHSFINCPWNSNYKHIYHSNKTVLRNISAASLWKGSERNGKYGYWAIKLSSSQKGLLLSKTFSCTLVHVQVQKALNFSFQNTFAMDNLEWI